MRKTKLFFTVLACLAFASASYAATYPITKTELVNVAECKPIVSSDYHAIPEYPISNINDGDRGTFMMSECGAAEAASEELTIDLLRRCKIEKIELFDRYDYDAPGGRQYIEILGANNQDFSDAVSLGSLDALDNEKFPHSGKLEFTLDGKEAYRYIRLKRTGGGDYKYAELRVWAMQTATDVARGTRADNIITDALADNSHWVYDFAPPTSAFDGDTATSWIQDGDAYRYLRVDLGSEYNIGMIELSARDMSADQSVGNIWAQKYIKFYGTNNDSTENSIFNPHTAPDDAALATEGFSKLITVGANNVYDNEVQFPSMWVPEGEEGTYGKAGCFQSTCDDTQSFRYIVYKNYYQLGSGLSGFRAYVINPMVNSAEISQDKIHVNFSDEMNEGSSNNVEVYVDEAKVEVGYSWTDAYTLELTLPKVYFDSKIRVVLSEDFENQKNVKMAEDTTVNLIAPAPVEVADLKFINKKTAEGASEIQSLAGLSEAGVSFEIKNNMPDKADTAVVVIGLYNEDNSLVATREVRVSLGAGESTNVAAGVDLGGIENAELKVFVWRDYDEMKPHIQKTSIK